MEYRVIRILTFRFGIMNGKNIEEEMYTSDFIPFDSTNIDII